jgi:glycosyltransferase involved in cell wall biosynthesis
VSSKKILFISHDASRTGAPILLLNFLKWFKQNINISFKIILGRGGPLEAEFAALAPVFVCGRSYRRSRSQRLLEKLGLQKPYNPLRNFLGEGIISLIYSNTVSNHHLLKKLDFLRCPIISHIHELEYALQLQAGEHFEIIREATTHYIAASNAVKENLTSRHNISGEYIDVVHEFLPIQSIQPNIGYDIRKELKLPDNAFVVGASGSFEWRKGTDLLIQLANFMNKQYPDIPIHFVWIGGYENPDNRQFYELTYDIQKLNLGGIVHLPGVKNNPLDYFSVFDVFALLSREDPYPIVCLEAASLEKPILCFEGSGGEPEFVEDDCGFVVPYLDLDTMAAKICLLAESTELKIRLGKNAAQKVKERHDIVISAPQISQIIKRFL